MRRLLQCAVAAAALCAAGAPPVERVGVTRIAIELPDAPPVASVLLVPGGTTRMSIASDGAPSNKVNFVIRTRDMLLDAGFAVAYVEDPTDLGPAIARLRALGRPVFLLGTSNGSTPVLRAAATLGAGGPDGAILTSTVTRFSVQGGGSAGDVDVRRVRVPVLLVHNRNDACFVSPASAIPGLAARFPAGLDVTQIVVASDGRADSDECGPLAPHGFYGIEAEVIGRIVDWIRARVPALR